MPDIDEINGIDFCNDVEKINEIRVPNVTSVNLVDKDCSTCTTTAISLGEGESCLAACRPPRCSTFYTTGTPGSLVVGDYIYNDASCLCRGATYLADSPCKSFNQGCFTLDDNCQITSIAVCR